MRDLFERETVKWIGILLLFTIIFVGHYITR
jgi:hypothetical protein